jgi:ureidoacrylate peracid hydrolase
MDLRGERSALLVVDMQNGFCHPQGSYARLGMPAARLNSATPGCLRLLQAARLAGLPVIFTRAYHEADFSDTTLKMRDSPKLPGQLREGFAVKGTWDYEVLDELRPLPGEYVIDKMRYSAFISAGLGVMLGALQIKNLIVCGVTTAVCVESNVRDACQNNYRVFVVSDAVAEIDQAEHDAALRIMDRMFAWVVNSAQAVAAMEALNRGRNAA